MRTQDESNGPESTVAGLDRATKLRLLSGADFWHTEAVDAAGIPPLLLTDGPHGLRKQIGGADHLGLSDSEPATCFPTAVALASTWDTGLLEEIGAALGAEARAGSVAVLLGPGLNIKRHPAGGRNFEYFSEDPHLSGKAAAAMVRGIQSQGVAACPKHFAVNNQEHERMRVDAVVDERTLREIYLAGFETVVREAKPWALMSAYNLVNGEHAGESHRLLTDILRGEWGFDGLVVSDWYATADRVAGVRAGMDLEMPGSGGAWDPAIEAALDRGSLEPAEVDRACQRLLQLVDRVTSDRGPIPAWEDLRDAHHTLARRVAAAGSVLLSNDGVLPIPAGSRIGVVGAFAEHPRFQGSGSSLVTPTRVDTFLSSLRARAGVADVLYAPGYDPDTGEATTAQLAEAVAVAAAADVLVVLVGLPRSLESEGWDRPDLSLPTAHDQLVEALTAVNERTVVVLQNGAAVDLPWSDRPAALLEAWLGGQASGSALADVLLGVVEPGGRLPESFPIAVADLPADGEFARHPTQVLHREGPYLGYRFHDTFGVPSRFAFGHGLGYTTWSYDDARVEGSGTDLEVGVTITNTGERRGSEVVQVYVHDVASTLHRPEQELKGFAKVTLDPGETGEITIDLDSRSFAMWDVASSSWKVEAGSFQIRVGASSRDIRAIVAVDVESDDVVAPVPAPRGPSATDRELAALLGGPVPAPRPLTPFHRDSTVGDLGQTWLGRGLRRLLYFALVRRLSTSDVEMRAMARAIADQAPLRLVAMNAGGRRALGFLDSLIALLNAATLRGGRAPS